MTPDTLPPEDRSEGPSSGPLAVAILTRNRKETVDRCLATFYEHAVVREVPVHVLVNGSTDDTAEMIRSRYPEVVVHESDVNLGCPGGRNLLMDFVDHPWVAHIDDDGTVGPGFVQAILEEILTAPPERAVITGWIIDVEVGPDPVLTSGLSPRFSGGIAAIRRSTFLELGGYPTDGHRQGEESDYAIRLHHNGHHIWQSASIVLFHPLRHSAEKRRELLRTGLRQSLLTGLRYAPWWFVIPWTTWKLGAYASLAIKLRSLGPYLAGMRDAAPHVGPTLRRRQPVRLGILVASTTRFRYFPTSDGRR